MTTLYKYIDGVQIELTSAEVAAWEAEQAARPPEPEPVPVEISRPQCAAEMLARSLIGTPEALAMATIGTPPPLVEAALAALPEPEQTFARIDFARYNYARGNPLLNELMMQVPTVENGVPRPTTQADIDQFFRDAASR